MSKKMLAIVVMAGFFPLFAAYAAAPVVSIDEQLKNSAELQRQLDGRNQVIADLQIQVTALQEDLRQLRGTLEEQDYKISQLLDRQRELYRDLDQRLSDLATKNTPVAVSKPVLTETAAAPATGGDAATVSKPAALANTAVTVVEASKPKPKADLKVESKAAAAANNEEAEQTDYDGIFPLVRNKQYPEAIKSYSDFLTKYPNGKNAPNARYWLGQIYYVQNQLDEADTQLKLVYTQYPESGKSHEALLKLAEIAKRRNLPDTARGFWLKIVQQYPDSASARIAQQKLQELK